MKKKTITSIIVISAALFLSQCTGNNVKNTLGLNKKSPDEFKVIANAPLSVPPDFSLRPPQPGLSRPQEADINEQAKALLLKENSSSSADITSKGETMLLQKTEADSADPHIKKILAREEQTEYQQQTEEGFLDKMIGYTHQETNHEPVVDAQKEKERLDENAQQGKPLNEGDVPTVEQKTKKGLLNRIFDF